MKPLSAELAAAARECVRRTRADQGLPPTIENPVTLDRIVAALGDPERPALKAAS